MSDHRSLRMAPMRCPVSCASTSARWNRQSTSRDTFRSAWYSCSERTTRVGFFSMGIFRPLSGFDSRSRRPRSSLDLEAQLRTEIRHLRSYSIIRSDTGLPLGPTLPALRARMNRSQSRCDKVAGSRLLPRNPRNIFAAVAVVLPRTQALGGRHLFTVDVKKRSQGERLGLGVLLAVQLRSGEPGGELVRLPPRLPPVAVLQRPGEPAPVVAPLDLVQAGLGIGKDPSPGSGPIRRRCSCAGLVSCVPSFDSFFDDGLHDLRV